MASPLNPPSAILCGWRGEFHRFESSGITDQVS